MKLLLLLISAFAAVVFASNSEGNWSTWAGRVSVTTTTTTATFTTTPLPAATCMTEADAKFVADSFITLITNTGENFNVTLAQKLLAVDFRDLSDSVNYLEEAPLGSVTFSNRSEFIAIAGTQPAFPSVTTLNLFHTCNVVTWRYRLDSGPGMKFPVQGIDIFVMNSNKQVQTIYAEQNSGAFLRNVGDPECQSKFTVKVAPGA